MLLQAQARRRKFFTGGSGYPNFTDQTEYLATQHDFVLVTDIADFYNQIYLHRLSNAVEFADKSLREVGEDIEFFYFAPEREIFARGASRAGRQRGDGGSNPD